MLPVLDIVGGDAEGAEILLQMEGLTQLIIRKSRIGQITVAGRQVTPQLLASHW